MLQVSETGQAYGKLKAGDVVVAINGKSVIGMRMQEAASIVTEGDVAQFEIAPEGVWEQADEDEQPYNEVRRFTNSGLTKDSHAVSNDVIRTNLEFSFNTGKKLNIKLGESESEKAIIIQTVGKGVDHGTLLQGDKLLAVNGEAIGDRSVKEATNWIKSINSHITLQVERVTT